MPVCEASLLEVDSRTILRNTTKVKANTICAKELLAGWIDNDKTDIGLCIDSGSRVVFSYEKIHHNLSHEISNGGLYSEPKMKRRLC